MARQKNLKIQLHNRINSLLAIGESKHDMKKVYREKCETLGVKWNPAKSPFIHSISSAQGYRQTINEFSSWLKEERPQIWASKNLSAITKDVAYEYLQYRDSVCSSFTVNKDMSALNKVLDLNLNKKGGGLSPRSYKNITRSRGFKSHDLKYNPANYSDQIEIAKAFGCRRESIKGGEYQIKLSSLFKHNGKVYISLIEKGGRYREAPCLSKYQAAIESKYGIQERDFISKEEFMRRYVSDSSAPLFDSYTSKIDNHYFRHEYAKDLYNEIAIGKNDLKENYSGFDKSVMKEVSQALGHNRLSVVINYLR